jgi:transaldolase / glucose-6-phosphate isomerase
MATLDIALAEPGLSDLLERGLPGALWEGDASAWPDVSREGIRDWVGWVGVLEQMQAVAPELAGWAAEVRAELPSTVLLGMGGSSLAPEVLRRTFGAGELHVLDTTHPRAVEAAERDDCLYLVASKSGSTVETRSHEAFFLERSGGDARRFVAVSDPGSGLAADARARGYRRLFENRRDIGGRYSALSYFGLVPAALAGLDVEQLLERAAEMRRRCAEPSPGNPGLALGAALGQLARSGRDKVTIVATGAFESFGLWAEQLVAESTGKAGTGLVPVVGEPLGDPGAYGEDRVFVHLRASSEADAAMDALRAAGQPVITLDVTDPHDVAAEFFRWEVATACAGSLLAINPFDQPNVQESKDNTNRLLAAFERDGRLPDAQADAIDAVVRAARPGAYVAIMAYVDPFSADEARYGRVRARLRDRLGVATTFGYGPRFLHSTGQLHKGGPQTGVFVQVVDPDAGDLPIPGRPFGFGTLIAAQSLGDLQALRGRDRPVARLTEAELEQALEAAMDSNGR